MVRYLAPLAIGSLLAIGCADSLNSPPSTQPTTADERQAAILKDPFGYGGNTDKVDITGGDIKTLDQKAMKKDLDALFNP
jgi:hypothetical protein